MPLLVNWYLAVSLSLSLSLSISPLQTLLRLCLLRHRRDHQVSRGSLTSRLDLACLIKIPALHKREFEDSVDPHGKKYSLAQPYWAAGAYLTVRKL